MCSSFSHVLHYLVATTSGTAFNYVPDRYVGTKYHTRSQMRRMSIVARIRIRYLRSTPSPKRALTMALENLAGDNYYPLDPGMQLSGLSAANESAAFVIMVFLCQILGYSSEGNWQLDQTTFADELQPIE
jgi:hypothetical protein